MTNPMTAKHAIDISVNEDRHVCLTYSTELYEDLLAECDDSNDTSDEVEFWGTSDTGSEWRVTLERDSGDDDDDYEPDEDPYAAERRRELL